ncbi:hypothetical protein H5407_19020 [Mitsuaria sp. WAJ17]|uniref:hypothetical protein n=1 Tax=Mitsuaria sp. WAJ17 TaxID=2761452 RepID=UPI0015FEBD40|nr:hypothetical protein [Mitsuaria sp. WAJ17]MBB2487332.1 hypothetical protein [Mitsuaria sp. WAJ17]
MEPLHTPWPSLLNAGRQSLRLGVVALSIAWAGTAPAAPACDAQAVGSQDYLKATRLVEQLPDFQAWTGWHRRPTAFGMPMDGQVRTGGRCYWSVSVYADEGDHLSLWNVFLVHLGSGDMLVSDVTGGEPLSLQAWRRKYGPLPDSPAGKR